jgi:CDP-paratose 2-epimerase
VRAAGDRFELDETAPLPPGCSHDGIGLSFSVEPPLSLYGASKLASETLAREFGHAFSLPVIIDRCGVMAGAGQFGTAEQGIFSYWVRSYAARNPLRYIGFDGSGMQVRDALHPKDLAELLARQITSPPSAPAVWNVGGGRENSMSLAQLSAWCRDRFGEHEVQRDAQPRRWDAPWIVMDSRLAADQFQWRPRVALEQILDEIAGHHVEHPEFLDLSEPP